MNEAKDYKLGVAILEAEVSQLNVTVSNLKTRLEPFEDLFPTMHSMADVNKLQRLLSVTSTITEEQLNVLGV